MTNCRCFVRLSADSFKRNSCRSRPAGASNITLAATAVISLGGSLAVAMSNSAATLTFGGVANSYFGITNVMEGILNVSAGNDGAFNTNQIASNAGQGDLLVIGNGQAGTQATVIDNTNSIPNNTTIIVNNTGAFTQTTTGDALGGFVLNGGTVQLAGTNGNLEDAVVALPSALPSALTMVSGASMGLARTGGPAGSAGAGYNVFNVFPGVGAAAGDELTVSGVFTSGTSGNGFVVGAALRDAFQAAVSAAEVAEIDANHYGVMAHPDALRAIDEFLARPELRPGPP